MMTPPDPSAIRQLLVERGISTAALALHLGVDRGHLHRILNGQRLGSTSLLRSIADFADNMPDSPVPRQEEMKRLIDAATHMFFVRRGLFESSICAAPVPLVAGLENSLSEDEITLQRRHKETGNPPRNTHLTPGLGGTKSKTSKTTTTKHQPSH
jgi:transcriptional regulator with XRE-family HTH domain